MMASPAPLPYAPGDTVVISSGDGNGATAVVQSVGVTGITLATAGSGYTSSSVVTIGAAGSGPAPSRMVERKPFGFAWLPRKCRKRNRFVWLESYWMTPYFQRF